MFKGKNTTLFDVAEKIRTQLQYSRIYFHPCRDLAEYYFKYEKPTFNMFTGFRAKPMPVFDQAAVDAILGHIERIFAKDNKDLVNYLVSWMADIVQFPDRNWERRC